MKEIDFKKPLRFSEASYCRPSPLKYLAKDAETGEIYVQHADGTIGHYRAHELENIPEKITRWVNMFTSSGYATKVEADMGYHNQNRIACIQVTFEPGEGL